MAEAVADANETSKLVESVPIPPPHAPPPPTMRMTTRDSNRLKRFSAYGVIDTAAALAGKEDALLAAALAVEDARETDEAKMILQNSSVVLTEADTALAEEAFAKSFREEESIPDSSPKPSKVKGKTKEPATAVEVVTAGKRRRRANTSQSAAAEEISEIEEAPTTATPTASVGRKRPSKPQSPKPSEPKRMSVEPPTPFLSSATQQTSLIVPRKGAHSLSELGSVSNHVLFNH
ncbi:unnamed protein product [Echinostoma caproni]|uniref:Uncharacterized protein n=1 Tax=Echinostoma caproni TaxID=27848 RepID=A0A183A1R3_9TREM|nr:unnamed protein product [Echinostoma caproni]